MLNRYGKMKTMAVRRLDAALLPISTLGTMF